MCSKSSPSPLEFDHSDMNGAGSSRQSRRVCAFLTFGCLAAVSCFLSRPHASLLFFQNEKFYGAKFGVVLSGSKVLCVFFVFFCCVLLLLMLVFVLVFF